MADIGVSVASTAGFLPQVWAQKALDVLRANITLARLCAKDTAYAPGWVGQQLNIPYPGTFTAQSKSADSPATVQTPSGGATVNVTLTNHYYVDFIVEDVAEAQSNMNLMERYTQPAAIALADQVETTLMQQIPNFTNPALGTSGTDLTAAGIRAANKVLTIAKVPKPNRFLVVGPKDAAAILGDSNLAAYFAYSKPENLQEGQLGRLFGFDIFESQHLITDEGTNDVQTITITGTPTGGTFTITFNGQTTAAIAYNATAATVLARLIALTGIGTGNVTVTGGPGPGTPWVVTFVNALAGAKQVAMTTTDSLTGGSSPASAVAHTTSGADLAFAFQQNGLLLATRPFRDPPAGAGVLSSTIVDMDSGLSIRVQHQYDMANRGVRVGFDILWGVVTLRPTLGVQILT